jgi:ATP-dependent DNA helicase RecG
MKSAEKEKVMSSFVKGETKILVSTTVIEVGVNVPNACLMIVENAERFGLSQLHQLRGRVGRGTRKSYCVLVSDAVGENAEKRLKTMCTTYDGYKIAEADLALRGPGDFLRDAGSEALRQSGGIKFKIADMCEDSELMQKAFESAKKIIELSPNLDNFPLLKSKVNSVFNSDRSSIS